MTNRTGNKMKIRTIYVYPIKSLRGCTVNKLDVTPTGFNYDRRFMLSCVDDAKKVSGSNSMHVARYTEVSLFTTEIYPPENPRVVRVRYSLDHVYDQPDNKLSLDDGDMLEVELEPQDFSTKQQIEVTMHSSPTMGFDMGGHFNDWFSRRLGYDVRLLYVGDNRREVLGSVNPSYKPEIVPTKTADSNGDGTTNGHTRSSSSEGGRGSGWFTSIRSSAESLLGFASGGVASTNPDLPSILDDDDDETKTNQGGPVQPVGQTTNGHKPNTHEYTGVNKGIGFADLAPFLVVSHKSWQNINDRLPPDEEMDVSKFRPNLIIEGAAEDFEEDFWGELTIRSPPHASHQNGSADADKAEDEDDGLRIKLTSNCARCKSLNVDYTTGKVGLGESGKITKKLASDRRVDKGMKWSGIFGRYGFLAAKEGNGNKGHEGTISVGDEVVVSVWNDERTRFKWPGISTDN